MNYKRAFDGTCSVAVGASPEIDRPGQQASDVVSKVLSLSPSPYPFPMPALLTVCTLVVTSGSVAFGVSNRIDWTCIWIIIFHSF